MEFREIYCFNCKKSLGRYNEKYFSEQKINEIIKANHSSHIHEGHDIVLKRITSNWKQISDYIGNIRCSYNS